MYYRCQTTTGTVMSGVHVDDIYSIVDPPEENAARFKAELRFKWDISDLASSWKSPSNASADLIQSASIRLPSSTG